MALPMALLSVMMSWARPTELMTVLLKVCSTARLMACSMASLTARQMA
jgi:hypothetical protein